MNKFEVSWGMGYLYSLKIIFHKILIHHKGKSIFTEKRGRHHVIKFRIGSGMIKTAWHLTGEGHRVISSIFTPTMHNLNLLMRKH